MGSVFNGLLDPDPYLEYRSRKLLLKTLNNNTQLPVTWIRIRIVGDLMDPDPYVIF